LKKREQKLDKKAHKKEIEKIGQDEDEYIESAFL